MEQYSTQHSVIPTGTCLPLLTASVETQVLRCDSPEERFSRPLALCLLINPLDGCVDQCRLMDLL